MKIISLIIFIFLHSISFGQKINILNSDTTASFRGLSVVNDKTVWVSGSNGTIGRSLDGGSTWKWMKVKGFEKGDFRDIEAFNETSAVIMAIGEPSYILRTIDGGETWKVVYENKTKGMFLDAMEFWNEQSGIVVGDPINNKFFIARTFDGGNTWREIPEQNLPIADSGEACFASSGTNIRALSNNEACFVSGGARSRLFIRDKKINIPYLLGVETLGANSVAVKNKNVLIVVGGDFKLPNSVYQNCFITTNGGKSWTVPAAAPHGYRSCIEYLGKKSWISCGINGVDYSATDGKKWYLISDEGFNVCRVAKNGTAVFLAGAKGKIGKAVFE